MLKKNIIYTFNHNIRYNHFLYLIFIILLLYLSFFISYIYHSFISYIIIYTPNFI